MYRNIKCMILQGIAGIKPVKLPPKTNAGDTVRKPLKPLRIIHIVGHSLLLIINQLNVFYNRIIPKSIFQINPHMSCFLSILKII